MFQLSMISDGDVLRDGHFSRTDFADTALPMTLCYAARKKYLKIANFNSAITCVVTTPELGSDARKDLGVLLSDAPQRHFFEIHNALTLEHGMRPEIHDGIHPKARIHPNAIIEEGVSIARDVIIEAAALVKRNSVLDEGVLVGAGALIGVEGHYYKRYDGQLFRVEHAGGVKIGARSQILAGAIVQKALHPTFTEIGVETVVSVGAHIGHGVTIGSHTTIAGSAQIAGYSVVGNNVWIGPSVVIRNLTTVGDGAQIEIGAVVAQAVPPGTRYSGPFAMPHRLNLKAMARIRNDED